MVISRNDEVIDPGFISKSINLPFSTSQTPGFGTVDQGEKIEIVGYTSSGIQLTSKGTGAYYLEDQRHVLVYPTVNTFHGESGGPIYNVDGDRKMIGIHIGKYSSLKTGLALDDKLREWINR